MGMSTYIVAFRSSEVHDKHIRILEMCQKEGVSLPKETAAYLNLGGWIVNKDDVSILTDAELEEMLEVDIKHVVKKWNDGVSAEGFEINVDDIPKEVKRIRFYNSW